MKPLSTVFSSFGVAMALSLSPLWPSIASAGAPSEPAVRALSKERVGVRLSYTLAPLALGQASALEVTTTGPAAGVPATITFRPDAALGLTSSDVPIGEPAAIGGTRQLSLRVTPQRAGLYYVNVFLQAGGRSQALAIPVQVGSAASFGRETKLQVSPSGERVISIPALSLP